MNTLENNDIQLNTNNMNMIEQNKNHIKKYVLMDLNQISNIITQKKNNIRSIDDDLIDEICNGLKLYCQCHNEMINDWFDNNYIDDLETLRANNKKYLEFANIYNSNSFVSINNFNKSYY